MYDENGHLTSITVKGSSKEDAVVEANFYLDEGYRVTGDPVRLKTFVPAYGQDARGRWRVYLYRVPVAFGPAPHEA